MRSTVLAIVVATSSSSAAAVEVTVKNDSLVDFSAGVVQAGFVTGERAASWLTAPCAGNLVGAQIFWRSADGITGKVLGDSITIHRAGTFPVPGEVAEQIFGPLLTDGVVNEYRYLDENNTIPLAVPVTQSETVIVSFTFAETLGAAGPSVVNDIDGIQPLRNAIYANLSGTFLWFGSSQLGVNGDWVIRAVIDCPAVPVNADVSASMSATPASYTAGAPLSYTITIANAGPAAAPGTTVVDVFPSALNAVAWTCSTTGGATCVSAGNGTIAQIVNLPAASAATYTVNATVAPGTVGVVSNTVTTVVGAPTVDPVAGNNQATVDTVAAANDVIFANGFEQLP
ncbi:MAG: hypothetical protein ABI650_11140 [Dokdonella sp.]